MRRLLLVPVLVLAAGCIPENGPLMSAGDDCLECHGGGGGGSAGGDLQSAALFGGGGEEDGPRWTFAGTVFGTHAAPASDGLRGAKVHVTDARGRRITLETNLAGNFYTAEPLVFPLHASVEQGGQVGTMKDPIQYGGCNDCHSWPPSEDAPGRLTPFD
jgi:hypothetical protein